MTNSNDRHAQFGIDPLFLDRWSPRAFDAQPMPEADLLTMMEAATWAPSASNSQPWRFVYALRDTEAFSGMLDLLVEFNQDWVKNASALVFLFSTRASKRPGSEPRPLRNHSFDSGTAWGYLALQAFKKGYFAHAMTGVHFDRISSALGAPEDELHFEAAIAIGRRGPLDVLPASLQEREKPNDRKPLSEMAFVGRMQANRN